MITKKIDKEIFGYNMADLIAILGDNSIKAETYNVDENGVEYGERDKFVSFSEGCYPFELTDEEISELK